MNKISIALALAVITSHVASADAAMTPGRYEYTVKMNMPGAPVNMPAQITERCLSARDVAGDAAFQTMPDSDCKVRDMAQTGSQFSYKILCTRPMKLDGAVKGTYTATGMAMDMTMSVPDAPGPMTQSISAKRIGDCKP